MPRAGPVTNTTLIMINADIYIYIYKLRIIQLFILTIVYISKIDLYIDFFLCKTSNNKKTFVICHSYA